MKTTSLLLVFFIATPFYSILGQKIEFQNPSFEDNANLGPGKIPYAWSDCGFPSETPPDTQPGSFYVEKQPMQGNSYLGMVVRDNNTYESICQKLSGGTLQKNNCYDFTLNACKSEIYISLSRQTWEEVNYTTPVVLRIYGGNAVCDKSELLFQSPPISNIEWESLEVRLQPKKGDYSFVVIEAYYKSATPYNGNVLIDNLSSIIPSNCMETFKKDTISSIQKNLPKESKIYKLEEIKTEKPEIKKGDIIQLSNVQFDADMATIKKESESVLNETLIFLQNNPALIIEIGGHTNSNPTILQANQLSLNRAKSVANWLIKKGINPNRLEYKGYGKTKPIASNETFQGREKNQRVEIKILETGK